MGQFLVSIYIFGTIQAKGMLEVRAYMGNYFRTGDRFYIDKLEYLLKKNY